MADGPVRGILGSASISYAPSVGAPVVVSGVFDASYVRVDLGTGVSSVSPAVFLRLSELPSNPETDEGATVTVAGVAYVAHEVQPDSVGGVLLLLHKVA